MSKLHDHLRGHWAVLSASGSAGLTEDASRDAPWTSYRDADAAAPLGKVPPRGAQQESIGVQDGEDGLPRQFNDPQRWRAREWREADHSRVARRP